jgi:hypothetical protein
MSASAPQIWEKFVPGADAIKEFWGLNKKEDGEK